MGTETPLNHFDPTLQYLLKSLKLKIILRKNDPLLFNINFAKLFYIMRLNQESLKYQAFYHQFTFSLIRRTMYLSWDAYT